MPRTRPGASILHCVHDSLHAAALPFTTVQKKRISSRNISDKPLI